ncbi:MAG: acyltransferase family protein [Candidatus Bathyarchaeota archaeon]|nr:acyltransferase family protein [Candidatus Bathyarchaeota archaeon]
MEEITHDVTSVDIIRVVAIILVIFLNATAFPYIIPAAVTSDVMSNWWTSNFYASFGAMGIPLLVMLSGALLLDKSKADEPIRFFFKKRFNRIGLALVFWTIIYFVWGIKVAGTVPSTNEIMHGIFAGSYYHLWFLYLLVGLYLATPILRVLIKNMNRNQFKYLLALTFIGTIIPSLTIFISFDLTPVMFVFAGWVGYYLLGSFLKEVEVKRTRILLLGVILGVICAIVGTYSLTTYAGGNFFNFFYNPLNFNIIISSTALFLLLFNVSPKKIQSKNVYVNRLIRWISENTLAIYLLHVIVLETFELGYLGFRISVFTMNAVLAIPLLVLVTLTLTSVIVYLVKKIPYIDNVIG